MPVEWAESSRVCYLPRLIDDGLCGVEFGFCPDASQWVPLHHSEIRIRRLALRSGGDHLFMSSDRTGANATAHPSLEYNRGSRTRRRSVPR